MNSLPLTTAGRRLGSDQSSTDQVKQSQTFDSHRSTKSNDLRAKLMDLQSQLSAAQEREKRALADYQNLVRRHQEERLAIIKLATKEIVSDLLEPLEHLKTAADQIQDRGLTLVVDRLWRQLTEFGVSEIPVLDQPFDVQTMEVIEKQAGESTDQVVVRVVRPGFKLNGEVIQHARVIMGNVK